MGRRKIARGETDFSIFIDAAKTSAGIETDSELGRMTGVDRHTIYRLRRIKGDNIQWVLKLWAVLPWSPIKFLSVLAEAFGMKKKTDV